MAEPKHSEELAARIAEQRRMLEQRSDVSQRLRDLSSSSSRNHIPAPARKTRSPLMAVLITSAALMAFFVCVAASVAIISGGLWAQSQLGSSSPSATAQDFYAALSTQNYAQAYSFLSSQARKELTEEAFQRTYQASDSLTGLVEDYNVTNSAINGSTASVTVDVVRRGNTAIATVFVLSLVQDSGAWRIATIKQTGSAPATPQSS
jgi:hypothetical protein